MACGIEEGDSAGGLGWGGEGDGDGLSGRVGQDGEEGPGVGAVDAYGVGTAEGEEGWLAPIAPVEGVVGVAGDEALRADIGGIDDGGVPVIAVGVGVAVDIEDAVFVGGSALRADGYLVALLARVGGEP